MNQTNQLPDKKPNKLANESSLYLRQHAFNPVNWHPWGAEALEKARKENKPLLVSIGYSACHWCHVMEYESFSDQEVAIVMNRHFVNIKIDREERPDLDQLFMEAVQLINGHGGWPLNCFALPDGRPFWGATYFRKSQWLQVLDQIATLYCNEKETLEDQACRVTTGIQQMNVKIESDDLQNLSKIDLELIFGNLSAGFDTKLGGFAGAPKFPMPTVYRFLLHYYHVSRQKPALDHVILTLNHLAAGGIYDHAGGGFARYSTDKYWKVPHFEKMLYDNAQLISLYCEAFMTSKIERFREIAIETMHFLERDIGRPDNGFSSSVDADSDLGEGSFYTFTTEELHFLLGEDAPLLIRYWKAEPGGNWENGKNILLEPVEINLFLRENEIEKPVLDKKIANAKMILQKYRNKRPRPSIDNKIIVSWNALMIQAYVNLYCITGNTYYLDAAERLAVYISTHCFDEEGNMLHIGGENTSAYGFLDDYASYILALILLYSVSMKEQWLHLADRLANDAIDLFYDKDNGLFFYPGINHEKSFTQRQDIHDNVIPSSNSIIMECLFYLGQITENEAYLEIVRRAVFGMAEKVSLHPIAFSNWARLMLLHRFQYYTISISGPDANILLQKLKSHFLPQTLITGTTRNSHLPLLKNRFREDETVIHVCSAKECFPAARTLDEIWKYLNINCE